MSSQFDLQNQLMVSSANCFPQLYCPPQAVLYEPRKLTIEAVDGGFIISGALNKGSWRTVAINPEGLAKLLKTWCAQFEPK